MSVKQGLLALLVERPRYGAELKTEFERRTGGTWPLNIGQVYTTLGRLQRDGLVEPAGEDAQRHPRYAVTDDGRADVAAWFSSPVRREAPARDELAIKLALAVTVPGVDVRALIQTQRSASLRALQEYTMLKRRPSDGNDLAWTLVLESLIFAAEAEVRWLDHCEASVARAAGDRAAASTRIGADPDAAAAAAAGGTPDVAAAAAAGSTPDVAASTSAGATPDVAAATSRSRSGVRR